MLNYKVHEAVRDPGSREHAALAKVEFPDLQPFYPAALGWVSVRMPGCKVY